ncbi:MAG: polysaccharide deacetylase family protein, partial [bacterium]
MRGKYLVIGLLLAGLGVLVVVLARVEHRLSRPRVVSVAEAPLPDVDIRATREEIEAAAARAQVLFRSSGDEFERLAVTSNARGEKTESWQKLFVVGVNLGAALPGHYPTEFGATRADYERWLEQMGEAGFNVVRAYTILPPEFYEALARHNFSNSERPVYLLQGIWAEAPESLDLFDPAYTRALKAEIRDAVDAVAGRAVREPRAGHASGAWSADVSAFTLGYLFGREWEPDVVEATDTTHRSTRRYNGVMFSVPEGSPTEVWLAGMLDYLCQYEAITYGTQRPTAFVSWLPIDPLYHSSEHSGKGLVYAFDNDVVTLDPMRIHTTPALRAGQFAAYHVYPYYPDFVFLEPKYREYRNARGEPDNYAGYVADLKRHHAGVPLLVAEFSVPSSRGNSHRNWFGMDHGGHDEAEQARINLAMLRAIHDEGCAGGVVFAWLDEWFKRNWLVDEFAVPADRVRLWHNVQNPEQCYGMVKFGRELVTVDGETGDWTGKPVARGAGAVRALWLSSDEEYCYLRLDLEQSPDWQKQSVGIAVDTYDPKLGSTRLGPAGPDCANGVEFLVMLRDTADAEVLVDSGYSVFSDPQEPWRRTLRTEANREGRFVTQRLMNNHVRFTALGESIPPVETEFGRLRWGRSDFSSLADWYERNGTVELRIPWTLFNVSDPSSHQVLQDDPALDGIQSVTTSGFALSAFIVDGERPGDRLVAALPPAKGGRLQFTRRWRWPGWDTPQYTERLKRSYHDFAAGLGQALADSPTRQSSLDRLSGKPAPVTAARIASFRGDAPGAVSVTFDDGSYDQYTYAAPVLDRYGLKANFGLVADWTGADADWHAEEDGIPIKRLGIPEAKELLARGHRISGHGGCHDPDLPRLDPARAAQDALNCAAALERALGEPPRAFHYPYSAVSPQLAAAVRAAGFWFARTAGERYNLPAGFDRYRLNSFAFYNDTLPGLREFVRILDSGQGKWTVLLHHRILGPDSKELEAMARHGVVHTYSVTPLTFGRQVRLVRNSRAWV